MTGIVDFHTHAFPDALAARAMEALHKECDIKSFLDGRISSLLASMDRAGIDKSVICSIATKPSQFDPILAWSQEIVSERLIPFPSYHPSDPRWAERISAIKKAGFKGIKFHPYYQEFDLDEKRMFPQYEMIAAEGLIVVMHTGFDVSFSRIRRADPLKIRGVLERFPSLKLVTTHLGAWDDWDEVERHLIGRKIYMELSFSLDRITREKAVSMISRHPAQCVLFGSDSPWTDQAATLSLLQGLGLGEEIVRRILRDNALALLEG